MRSRLCFVRRATSAARSLAAGLTATLLVVVLVASACAPQSSRVGAGGECFLATDCAPGLICIEQADKTRLCSDDLSRVAGRPASDGGAEADGAVGEGGTSDDGAVADGASQPPDTGAPDTSTPSDAGAPPVDASDD